MLSNVTDTWTWHDAGYVAGAIGGWTYAFIYLAGFLRPEFDLQPSALTIGVLAVSIGLGVAGTYLYTTSPRRVQDV